MCVSVQYIVDDRLHVVFVVGDNLLAICIRPNGTSREAEERPQLVQIFSETTFVTFVSDLPEDGHLGPKPHVNERRAWMSAFSLCAPGHDCLFV